MKRLLGDRWLESTVNDDLEGLLGTSKQPCLLYILHTKSYVSIQHIISQPFLFLMNMTRKLPSSGIPKSVRRYGGVFCMKQRKLLGVAHRGLAEALLLVASGSVGQEGCVFSLHSNVVFQRDVADLDAVEGPAMLARVRDSSNVKHAGWGSGTY